MSAEQRAAAWTIGAAIAATLILAAYYYGVMTAVPQPLPAAVEPMKHGVAYRLHAHQVTEARP